MPCTGPGPDPTGDRLRETASLLVFLTKKLKRRVEKAWVKAIDHPHSCDDLTPVLCGLLMKLGNKELTQIVYNARNPQSRRLADWWERHQAADRRRLREEAKEQALEERRERALAKLTPAEAAALGFKKRRKKL